MIINHSSLSLANASHERSSLSIQQKQSISSLGKQANNQANNQSLALTTEAQYRFENSKRSGMTARSTIIEPSGQATQHSMIKTTEQLTAYQFASAGAQIAIRQAFPSQPGQKTGESIQASGLAEFHFSQHIQFEELNYNAMSAQGNVTLSDGREIAFNLHLEHQQNTRIEALTQMSLQKVVMTDPLVINLGDQPVSLQSTTFEFDLLANGQSQKLAQLGTGAGYLTFDINGDGLVSDGSELFGTKTGNAYAELAVHDEDGNGWIDENDSIFSQLKLWMDQTNQGATISLAEAGVGAIYLGNVPYEYALRSDQGALLGQSKEASIVLMENGEVKTSQAIDLMPIINANTIDLMENDPAFKQLAKMTKAFNTWQQAQSAWNEHFAQFQNSGPSSYQASKAEKPKNIFEELTEQIEKMLAERRAFFDKMFGKTDKLKLGQA